MIFHNIFTAIDRAIKSAYFSSFETRKILTSVLGPSHALFIGVPMPRRPALYPRPRWQWAEDMPHRRTDWAEILSLEGVNFLTENQVGLWVSPEHTGVDKVWFYPVPRAPHLDGDRYDVDRIARESIHALCGPKIEVFRHGAPISWDAEPVSTWQPFAVRRTFQAGDFKLSETVTVLEDMIAVWFHPEGDCDGLHVRCDASTDRTKAASWRAYDETQVCLHEDGVANGWVWLGSPVEQWRTSKTKHCMNFEASLPATGALVVLMLGYDQAAVERRLESMLAKTRGRTPLDVEEMFLEKARSSWETYFSRMVPALQGCPEWVRRLYYYQMATHRINLFDIPYEPFASPYTCPWKTSAVWQWSWNTGMNAVAERWLNDPSWAESGTDLVKKNGGALNIGASLHRLRKPREFRDVYDYLPAMRRAMEGNLSLPATARQFDWAFVMPYTTPLGIHGIWEIFQRTGDMEYLEDHLNEMLDHEETLSSHDPDGDGLVNYSGMVDEYDYSLRWKTSVKDFGKGNRSLLEFERPLELIDINAQLCLLREDLIKAARILSRPGLERRLIARLEKTKAGINDILWDEERGCYGDVDAQTHESTGVYSVAAYSALMAGIATPEQAQRMVDLLDDPEAFGSEYPVPSVMMNTEDLDPSLITYGGDVLITSGVWTTVLGLVRYGYTDKAREVLWKVLDMVGGDGPTSSYSYNSVTGQPNQDRHQFCSQSAILSDLFLRYVIGFIPRADDVIECWPFALPEDWDHFEFGPFVWRGEVDVTISWDRDSGYAVQAGESSFTTPKPRRLFLGLDENDQLAELDGTLLKDHLLFT